MDDAASEAFEERPTGRPTAGGRRVRRSRPAGKERAGRYQTGAGPRPIVSRPLHDATSTSC